MDRVESASPTTRALFPIHLYINTILLMSFGYHPSLLPSYESVAGDYFQPGSPLRVPPGVVPNYLTMDVEADFNTPFINRYEGRLSSNDDVKTPYLTPEEKRQQQATRAMLKRMGVHPRDYDTEIAKIQTTLS